MFHIYPSSRDCKETIFSRGYVCQKIYMASRIAYYSSKFTISIYINVAAYLDTTTGSQFIYLFPLTTPGGSSSVLGDIVAIILIMA
jgi:hypothetical protein